MKVILNIKIHIYSKAERRFLFLDKCFKLRDFTLLFSAFFSPSPILLSSPTDSLFPESSGNHQK